MTELGKVGGKTFLITGAASGLGAGYAEAFLEDGAKSVAVLDVAEAKGKSLVEKLNQRYPGKAMFVRCDVSSESNITEAFDEVLAIFGTVDVIINNAGIFNDTPSGWRKACDVNYQGLISFTLKGICHMRTNEGGKGGTIINVSSTGAIYKHPVMPIYCGAKAAVLHFSHSLAMDPFHERTGVRILTICIGPTDTPILHNKGSLAYDKLMGQMLEDLVKAVQKPESAIKGMVDMFKQGANGSIWLVVNDKPAADITPHIDICSFNPSSDAKPDTIEKPIVMGAGAHGSLKRLILKTFE